MVSRRTAMADRCASSTAWASHSRDRPRGPSGSSARKSVRFGAVTLVSDERLGVLAQWQSSGLNPRSLSYDSSDPTGAEGSTAGLPGVDHLDTCLVEVRQVACCQGCSPCTADR